MSLGNLNGDVSADNLKGLAESSVLFDQVLSSITDFVYVFDLEGRFTFMNRPLLDLWGLRLEDAVGKTFFELPYEPELASRLQKEILDVVRTGERYVGETRYDSPTGVVGYYQYIFSPIFDESGKVTAVAGSTRDISEGRRLEVARQQSADELEVERANLAEVVEKAPSFVCLLRGSKHVFELANERYFELIGRDDILGKPVREALPEVEGQGFFELLDKVFETGESFYGDEAPVTVGPVGSVQRKYINFVYQAIRGTNGKIDGVFVHGVDVTGLVESRKALEESEDAAQRQQRLYEAILDNTPDLAYIFGLDHRFVYANKVLLQMWGKTKEEAIGKNCLELGYEDWHAAMHDREIEQVVATKLPVRGEVPFHGTFGRRIYDYILVPVIGVDGNVEAVAGTTRDITDRVELEGKLSQQAEQLANESRQKDEFLAMLSHELRNPLAPISSAIQVLKLTRDEEDQREAREIIERQVGNLTKIVSDLLEVSRVVSGRIRLDISEADINQVMTHAVETVQPMIDRQEHHLTVTLADEPMMVEMDATRIEEVFVNLLNNAAKYTREGGLIEVTCEVSPDRNHAQVRVRDNGEGIEDKLLPVIFDLFTQGERSLDRAAGGLGIGLSLASKLVALHGGTIEVQSPPVGKDRGSEFTVTFPLSTAHPVAPLVVEPIPVQQESDGMRVLVVDDNRDLVNMLSLFLRHNDYEVANAFDGIEACEVAHRWHPDVIVLDIGLPGLNGYEVVKKLREDEVTKNARIIAITGYGADSDVAKAHEAGFDAHLTKPYGLDELDRLIKAK